MPMKVVSFLLAFISYIAFDYDFLSVSLKLIPFPDYIAYYPPRTRILLYGIKTTLESVNLILFILFLYQVIQTKIRENKEFIRLNTELQKTVETLKSMTGKIEEAAKIKERNRLAHDVHDILGHSLTCIDTGLEASITLASGHSMSPLVEQLTKIKRIADIGLRDIRKSVHALEGDSIQNSTLIDSLKELVRDVNSVNVQNVSLVVSGTIPAIECDERQTIYRMVQESITNSIKHGRAKNITISLLFENNELNLKVQDDGIGCKTISENFGISHMREQTKLLGGTIGFETRPAGGFAMHAILPIRRSPDDISVSC
jgi:signal transduction histidine kinase